MLTVVVATWALQTSTAQSRKLLQFFSMSNWILISIHWCVSNFQKGFPFDFDFWFCLTMGGLIRISLLKWPKKWPWLGVSAPLAIKTTPCQHLVTGGLISSLSRISTGGAWPQLDCKPIFGTSAGKRPGQHFNNGGLGGLPGQLGSHTEVTHEASWPTKTKCAPTCHHYKIQKEPPFISNPLLQIACSTNSIKTCFYKKQ